MSGIEVAGIVLAVFPIVVKGLGSYVEGVQTVRTWRQYRRELDGYKRQLETQRVWYLDTLEELLGFVQSEEDLKELISDPGGTSWHNLDYEQHLRERLDHSYAPYLRTIRELLSTLQVMQRKLGIDAHGQVMWEDAPALKRQVERLKLVMSKSVYAELIRKIEKANVNLREFTHQNRLLEPIRRRRRYLKRRSPDFGRIRTCAKSLHNIMVKNGDRYWKCACRQHHRIHIRLEPRAWDDAKWSSTQSLRFRLLLSGKTAQFERHLPHWRELEIDPVELPNSSNEVGGEQEGLAVGTATGSISHKARKSVKFASDNGSIWSASSVQSQGSQDTTKPLTISHLSISTVVPPISDICAILQSDQRISDSPVGFVLDDEQPQHHRHEIYTTDLSESQSLTYKTESLADLLSSERAFSVTRPITRRDRLYMAALLASSVLQLDGSWLRRSWSSRDIHFMRCKGSGLVLDKPYVSWPLLPYTTPPTPVGAVIIDQQASEHMPGESRASAPATTQNAAEIVPTPNSAIHLQRQSSHLIRSEVLFPLGLALTELSLGHTLANLREPVDEDPNEAYMNLKTASRLVDQVYSESGTRYGDAVLKCLHWTEVRDARLENDEFQQAVFDLIMTPLFEDLQDFDGAARIR